MFHRRLVRLAVCPARNFSVRTPKYPGHVPLGFAERALMLLGTAVRVYREPKRADLVAAFGELTAFPCILSRLKQKMLRDSVGRQILWERPRITSSTLDLAKLRGLPPNSFGRTYVDWLDREGVTPDSRLPVKYIDDPEEAYIMQRYRESHDFYHAISGLPILMEGEIVVKAFEYHNLGLPMTYMAAYSTLKRVKPQAQRRLREIYIPWAQTNGARCKLLLNVYWENRLEQDVHELRHELGIVLPPDLRQMIKADLTVV